LCSTVNTALFSAVLAHFAEATGAGRTKTVILVLDQAGWHVSEHLTVPNGIRLAFLPPYSPELQPAERLWPLAREAIANQSFARLDDLDQALAARCLILASQPETIKAHTLFHWWPKTA
jgi:transposase